MQNFQMLLLVAMGLLFLAGKCVFSQERQNVGVSSFVFKV